MTAGYPQVHDAEIESSIALIRTFEDSLSGFQSAIDVAGGFGRISKEVLTPNFRTVDLLD